MSILDRGWVKISILNSIDRESFNEKETYKQRPAEAG